MTDKEILWLASYPRSGNSWVRFLFGAYAHGAAESWHVCNDAFLGLHALLAKARENGWGQEALLQHALERFDALTPSAYRPTRLAFKTHFKGSPSHILGDRTHKVIYLLRHPKDVLLSWINYLELIERRNRPPGPEAARRFIEVGGDPVWIRKYGTWLEHYESWNANPAYPTLLVRYEDLKRDTVSEFLRMIAFLDLPIDEERARRAVKQTAMQKLRQLEVEAREEGIFFDAQEGRYFIHKGASGQTLHHLGNDLDAAFNERFAPWLEATGYRA